MRHSFRHQANGVDRPSFGASVITNQSKHDLSEREQAWLVGHMLYVSKHVLVDKNLKVSFAVVSQVERHRPLRFCGGSAP